MDLVVIPRRILHPYCDNSKNPFLISFIFDMYVYIDIGERTEKQDGHVFCIVNVFFHIMVH